MNALKNALSAAGSGQSQSSDGGGGLGNGGTSPEGRPGGGAGTGSTNEDQGKSAQQGGSPVSGSREAEFKEGQYETIYDPERVQTAQESTSTNQNKSLDDSVQVEMGPGRGTLNGDIPYQQVIGEYAETAAQAAESERLSAQERQWVSNYFSLLTGQE